MEAGFCIDLQKPAYFLVIQVTNDCILLMQEVWYCSQLTLSLLDAQ